MANSNRITVGKGHVFRKAVWDSLSKKQQEVLIAALNRLKTRDPENYSKIVSGKAINTGDLRRLGKYLKGKPRLPGSVRWENSGLDDWLKSWYDEKREGYEGPRQDDEGNFEYGKGASEGSGFLQGIYDSLSPEQIKKYTRGGRITMGDLRRLYRGDILTPEQQSALEKFLKINRDAEDDDDPPPGPGDPGDPDGPTPPDFPKSPKPKPSPVPDPDPETWAAMKDWILKTFTDPGYDPEMLEDMRNTQRASAQTQIRNQTQNAAERLAARGISDSGLAERTYQGIESEAYEGLQDNLVGIDVENARAALAAVQQAFQGALGMDAARLDRFQLQLQAEMQAFAEMAHNDNTLLAWFGLKLQEHLGQGQLDLQRLYYELAADQNFWDWFYRYAGIKDKDEDEEEQYRGSSTVADPPPETPAPNPPAATTPQDTSSMTTRGGSTVTFNTNDGTLKIEPGALNTEPNSPEYLGPPEQDTGRGGAGLYQSVVDRQYPTDRPPAEYEKFFNRRFGY